MIHIIDAILAIKSDAQVNTSGTTNEEQLNTLVWIDDNPTGITNEQILAKQAELQTAYDAEQWKRNRQAEYPDAIECVHALLDGGDTLTDLQAKRTAIKEKYPKE